MDAPEVRIAPGKCSATGYKRIEVKASGGLELRHGFSTTGFGSDRIKALEGQERPNTVLHDEDDANNSIFAYELGGCDEHEFMTKHTPDFLLPDVRSPARFA